MTEKDTLTLTLHGLTAFHEDVDGEVFARKFFKLMQALGLADKTANGSRRLKYLISKLENNTATGAVREQIISEGADFQSGIQFFERGADAIYHNRPEARKLPADFVKYVAELSKGSGEKFERGVLKRAANENIIQLDVKLEKNCARVLEDIQRADLGKVPPFSGTANISLDGTVKTLEQEGEGDKAVIVLTAGGKRIDCLVSEIADEELRTIWKKRCRVYGLGHYTGDSNLPDYIVAKTIRPVLENGDWISWKGAFSIPDEDSADWN